MGVLVEICVDSVETAQLALAAGADRLELCADLSVGGLTPSESLFEQVSSISNVPVFVMIRCRSGDFIYADNEKQQMLSDALKLLRAGASGFVSGALTLIDGEHDIDVPFMKELVHLVSPLPVTFHKAIDRVGDAISRFSLLSDIGVMRILTSGTSQFAEDGVSVLKRMVELGKPVVIVAGGVRAHNLIDLIEKTCCFEIHSRSPEICDIIKK